MAQLFHSMSCCKVSEHWVSVELDPYRISRRELDVGNIVVGPENQCQGVQILHEREGWATVYGSVPSKATPSCILDAAHEVRTTLPGA